MAETLRSGVSLHYEVEGTGPPVVLIHGHTLDLSVMDGLVGPLVGAGMQVVRFDLRGHGRSGRPDSGYHVSHHAADVAAVMDTVGADRAALVGYSIGGGIALETALTMPDRVVTLTLLSPVLPDRPYEPEFFDSLRQVARVTRSDGIRAAMLGPWLDSPLWATSLTDPVVRQRLASIVERFPGAEYLASARDRVDREWIMPDRLAEITQPTTVAVGELELPGFLAYAEEIAEGIPGAQLEVLEGLGHLHLLQDPDRVVKLVVDAVIDGGSNRNP